jgi:hypothetical protein
MKDGVPPSLYAYAATIDFLGVDSARNFQFPTIEMVVQITGAARINR